MKTILIVDDYRPMLLFERKVLIQEGFEILEAEDGAAALEIAKAKLPDLIISDVRFLPGEMDGFKFFSLVQKEPRLPGVCFLESKIADKYGN